MSSRLCPRCSSVIESESAIFCYNCGQELDRRPESLSPDSSPNKSSSIPGPVLAKSPAFHRRPFLYFLLSASLLVALLASLYLTGYFGRRSQPVSPTPSANEVISTVSALPVAPFDFGKYPLADLAPAGVSLYLESSNPRIFLERFLNSAQIARLQTLSGLNLSEIASFFEPNFAYIEDSSASPSAKALIGVGKDLEFIKGRAGKIGNQTDLVTATLGPYFVVSNSARFLKEIGDTEAKTNLSLSATAAFNEAKKQLPASGQVFLYGRDLPAALRGITTLFGNFLDSALAGLRGTSFVITIKSGSTAIEGANDH